MRRNTKTMYEWRKAYRDKEELMLERGFPEVSPHEFYRDLFPEGSLQSAEHDGKGNLIATQIRPSGKGRTKQWVVDDSLNMLDKVIGDEFGLIPPIPHKPCSIGVLCRAYKGGNPYQSSFTADTGTYRVCADKVVCKRVYEVERVLLN